MNTDSQFNDFPRSVRILLVLWGIVGLSAGIWVILRQEPIEAVVVGLLLAVMVLPLLALCYYACGLYIRTLQNVKNHALKMGELFNSTLSTLALAIDAKDKQRQGHTHRVQEYARAIAEGLKLDKDEIRGIAAAALLHDIGKLAIPEYILNKREGLTREETRKMRMHPELGADIISNIKFPFPVADSILAHHERFDGDGYPKGIAGKDIPLAARILAVADAFDAYLADRTESKQTLDDAIQSIREASGSAFDPEVVAAWESIYRDVVVWPSASAAHIPIHQAASELKMLESFGQAIEGLTSVQEILFASRACIIKSVQGCIALIDRGEREGIPIAFGGKVIATIRLDRPGAPLTEDEVRLVHAVAAKVAPTLNNAIALEAARREATLDKLTGLANRRAFEVMSGSLERQHFSIVLIDANSFKKVNDNFGHTAGDATLIRIAAHLRASFQDAQLICRLGGDEFLVLSFASVKMLRSQIRRFRQMVTWDPAHEAYRSIMFGVSCGLASIPGDASNIEHAMQCADERMYALKARYKQFAGRATGGPAPTGTEALKK